MADAKVSKTFDHNGRVGSTPTFGTTISSSTYAFRVAIHLSQHNVYDELTVTGIEKRRSDYYQLGACR